jgi:hypothetical protein
VTVKKIDDGRYVVFCRVCPKRVAWRLPKDARTGVFDDGATAYRHKEEHLKDPIHARCLESLADPKETPEEALLRKIFGGSGPAPCDECGHSHAAKVSCEMAATIRRNVAARERGTH